MVSPYKNQIYRPFGRCDSKEGQEARRKLDFGRLLFRILPVFEQPTAPAHRRGSLRQALLLLLLLIVVCCLLLRNITQVTTFLLSSTAVFYYLVVQEIKQDLRPRINKW